MTEQPEPQDADEAFYASIYGPPTAPPLTAEDEDLYNQIFPTK